MEWNQLEISDSWPLAHDNDGEYMPFVYVGNKACRNRHSGPTLTWLFAFKTHTILQIGKGSSNGWMWQWLTGDRPDLSSERAHHRDNTATFRQRIISGHKFQSELDTKTTDWPTVVTWLWLWLWLRNQLLLATSLCWIHRSCLEQICYSVFSVLVSKCWIFHRPIDLNTLFVGIIVDAHYILHTFIRKKRRF
jgi:hypothetical protein